MPQHDGVIPETYSQRNGVNERIQLEYPCEEHAEVIEHFREEIPEESRVRRQIICGKYESVGALQKIPAVANLERSV